MYYLCIVSVAFLRVRRINIEVNNINKPIKANCQNGNKASISRRTASVEQTTKSAYSNKLSVTGESKKRKRESVRQYDKKYLELGFTIAPCNEQSPRPLCLVCPEFSQMTSCNLRNLLVTFIQSTTNRTTCFKNLFNASLASHTGSETAVNFTLTLILYVNRSTFCCFS